MASYCEEDECECCEFSANPFKPIACSNCFHESKHEWSFEEWKEWRYIGSPEWEQEKKKNQKPSGFLKDVDSDDYWPLPNDAPPWVIPFHHNLVECWPRGSYSDLDLVDQLTQFFTAVIANAPSHVSDRARVSPSGNYDNSYWDNKLISEDKVQDCAGRVRVSKAEIRGIIRVVMNECMK